MQAVTYTYFKERIKSLNDYLTKNQALLTYPQHVSLHFVYQWFSVLLGKQTEGHTWPVHLAYPEQNNFAQTA